MDETIRENGIYYQLNKKKFTAKVIGSIQSINDALIPCSIQYQSHEYITTEVKKGSFKNTNVKSIEIPSSVNKLKEGWCKQTKYLNKIKIQPKNKNFKYLDKENQIIVRKSDPNASDFDTIVFVSRNIKRCIIPKTIKFIESYAFENCEKLEFIQIPENSELQSIGKKSFSNISIQNLFIPSNVNEIKCEWNKKSKIKNLSISPKNKKIKFLDNDNKIVAIKNDFNKKDYDKIIFVDLVSIKIPKSIRCISSYSFFDFNNLVEIQIQEDSELRTIEKCSFSNTKISKLFISANVEELKEDWCKQTMFLNDVIISPKNKNFKYLDKENQIIVRKSDPNTSNFDTIVFASRNIKRCIIPKTIKFIESYSFENCEKLEFIEFSKNSNLLKIGKSSFEFCNFEQITIPASVLKIRKYAFHFCKKLKSVKFEKGSQIRSLSSDVFSYCYELNEIELSDELNILYIDKNAFTCSSIESIFIPESTEELKEGWCYDLKMLNKVIISPKNKNFKYLDKENQIIVRKSDPNTSGFDTIVFASRNIKRCIIPKTIKFIESHAFENCEKLEEITFENNSQLQSIGKNAFFRSSIESFIVPKNVYEIGQMSFLECHNLKRFEIENCSKLLSISERLFFNDMNLETLKIPENSSLKKIEANAFNSTSIKSLFIPETLEELDEEWCRKIIYLNEVIVSPKNKHFIYLDKKHEIIIRKSEFKTNFDTIAFATRDIENVKIPKTIKYIDSYAFENCVKLNYIEIPEDSEIESFHSFFNLCSTFENIFISPSTEKFSYKNNYCYLDDDNEIIVRKNDKTNNFDTIVFANRTIEYAFIPESIKFIDESAFLRCSSLEIVEFSKDSKLQQIGKNAFSSSGIQSITIPKSVCIIGNNAFSKCYNLNEVIIEKESQLLTIPKCLFDGCIELSIVSIPKNCSLQKISSLSFIDTSIESIFIPETVNELEEGWFYGIEKLNEVKISPKNKHFKYLDNEKQIILRKSDPNIANFDTIAFAVRNIKRATIPLDIKYIDSNAFEGCEELDFLRIPDDSELINIGNEAFMGSSIKSFIVPKNIYKINEIFNNCSNLMSLEFQGELIIIENRILLNCPRLSIISFPNVLNLNFKKDVHQFAKNFTLFIQADAKFCC